MSDDIPTHFKTFGPLGEQRIARGNAIRVSHGVDLIEAANHQRAKLCTRWVSLVASRKRIRQRPPEAGGIVYEWEGFEANGTSFERIAWTTYAPQDGRLDHTLHFDFEEGQVRYRTKPSSGGGWGSYVTSSTQTTRATWSPAHTFADAQEHQIEVEFRALADPSPVGRLFAAVLVEDEGVV